MIAGVIFLLSGGLYSIVTGGETPVYITLQSSYTFFTPYDLNTQLALEGVVAIFFLGLGAVGGYIIHRSQRSLRDPRLASMLLIIGIAFIIIGVFSLSAFLQTKVRPI